MKFIALCLLLFLLIVKLPAVFASKPSQKYLTVLLPNGSKLKAEIADTPEARQMGLMFRKRLPDGTGMLFIFPAEAPHRFWTKNCRFPLDMIWLNKKKEIIYIAENLPPCERDPCPDYGPSGQALYVIETAAGFAKQQGLKPGMAIKFK